MNKPLIWIRLTPYSASSQLAKVSSLFWLME
jgi:hypothetical protein